MTYVDQEFNHDPENGIWGDCARACIASILNLDLKDVPNFAFECEDRAIFQNRKIEFLKSFGLKPFLIPFKDHSLEEVLDLMDDYNPDSLYTLCGKSQRGLCHVVVCKGDRIIHDPHYSKEGIMGPYNGFLFVEVLTPF